MPRYRLSLDIDGTTHKRLRRLKKKMNAATITEVIRRLAENAETAEPVTQFSPIRFGPTPWRKNT